MANGIEGAGVAIVDKVGGVVVGARATVILQSLTACNCIQKEILTLQWIQINQIINKIGKLLFKTEIYRGFHPFEMAF